MVWCYIKLMNKITEKQRRLSEYGDMINAVDTKLAEISKIIKTYDLKLSENVDDKLTSFIDYLEGQNSKL